MSEVMNEVREMMKAMAEDAFIQNYNTNILRDALGSIIMLLDEAEDTLDNAFIKNIIHDALKEIDAGLPYKKRLELNAILSDNYGGNA